MSYDIHGPWDIGGRKWTQPFVNSHTNLTEIQSALDLLWRNRIDPKKVVLGLAFYSRTFTLTNPKCSEPGCVVTSGGRAGRCSHTTGVLLNPEIEDIIAEKRLETKFYREAAYKAVKWDNQWVPFDDKATWNLKAQLARSQCISGVMVWALSQDNKDGKHAVALTQAVGRQVMKWPKFGPRAEASTAPPRKIAQLCRWSNCNENCPNGFKEVPRDGTKLMMTGQ
jgi:chitinase